MWALLSTCARKRVALLEHLQLPAVRGLVVAQEVDRSVVASDLEVSVVRTEPAVDHLDDLDAPTVDLEPPRRLLAAISGVTVDLHVHDVPALSTTSPRRAPAPAALQRVPELSDPVEPLPPEPEPVPPELPVFLVVPALWESPVAPGPLVPPDPAPPGVAEPVDVPVSALLGAVAPRSSGRSAALLAGSLPASLTGARLARTIRAGEHARKKRDADHHVPLFAHGSPLVNGLTRR